MNIVDLLQIVYTAGVLVFLLVFTIVFAVLQKTHILGMNKKNFNVVVALIMGLLVIVPHITGNYPATYDVVDIINQALPNVSLIAIAAIMLLLLVGLFGAESRWMGTSLAGWMAIMAFVSIIIIFGSAMGMTGWSVYDYIDQDTVLMIVILLVFGIIVWYITKEPSDSMSNIGKTIDSIGSWFGKK
jgi:hypothetical protein